VNIMEGNFGAGVQRRLDFLLRNGADTALAVVLIGILAVMVILRYL